MMPKKRRGNCTGLPILTGVIRLTAIASLHVAGFLGIFSTPAQAVEQFDNSGIQFDVDTVVEFQFIESHGAYQSTFGVINLNTGQKTPLLIEVKPYDNPQDVNRPSKYRTPVDRDPADFLGTPGNTVPKPLAEFEFKANTPYAFYLESTYNGKPAGIFYSINAQNPGKNQQVKFQGDLPALAGGGIVLSWDDTGSLLVRSSEEDRDYNDFIVQAGGHLACPYGRTTTNQQQSQASLCGSAKGIKSHVKFQIQH